MLRGKRRPISSTTLSLVANERPRSPCTAFQSQFP